MEEIKFIQKEFTETEVVYDLLKDGQIVGSLELELRENECYIANIRKSLTYKGSKLLEEVINQLIKNHNIITCLPLPKYRTYFEQLGFKIYKQEGEDIYYILNKNI